MRSVPVAAFYQSKRQIGAQCDKKTAANSASLFFDRYANLWTRAPAVESQGQRVGSGVSCRRNAALISRSVTPGRRRGSPSPVRSRP